MADRPRGSWRWKLMRTAVVAGAVWLAAGAVGFPLVFRWFFVGYVALALPFYLLLDAGAGRLPRRPVTAILTFFIVVSGVLTAAGFLLPRYDPRVEQEKIRRLQQAALEKDEAKRLDSLRQLAAKHSLELVRAGEAPATAAGAPRGPAAAGPGAVGVTAERAAPDPKLVAQGQQVYNGYECYNCHKLGGKGGVKRRGPEMDNVGSTVSAEMLRAKILDPLVFLTEGYEQEYTKVIMPDDFKERMGPKEVDALVAYMTSLKAPDQKTPKPLFKSPKGLATPSRMFCALPPSMVHIALLPRPPAIAKFDPLPF